MSMIEKDGNIVAIDKKSEKSVDFRQCISFFVINLVSVAAPGHTTSPTAQLKDLIRAT